MKFILKEDFDFTSLNDDDLKKQYNWPMSRHILDNQVVDKIVSLENESNKTTTPKFFKLGYAKWIHSLTGKYLAIFVATEYDKVYLHPNWRNTQYTAEYDREVGIDRHTGERTGFGFKGHTDETTGKFTVDSTAIGRYNNLKGEVLQAYLDPYSKKKARFFGFDKDHQLWVELTSEDIARNVAPREAKKLLEPLIIDTYSGPTAISSSGKQYMDTPVQRFYISRIFEIDDLGASLESLIKPETITLDERGLEFGDITSAYNTARDAYEKEKEDKKKAREDKLAALEAEKARKKAEREAKRLAKMK